MSAAVAAGEIGRAGDCVSQQSEPGQCARLPDRGGLAVCCNGDMEPIIDEVDNIRNRDSDQRRA